MSNDVGKVLSDSEPLSENLENLRAALARKTTIEADAAELEWSRMEASKDNARIYSFIGPVNIPSAQLCMDTLGQWVREDSEREIQIVFNSPGGSVMDGLALYDYMESLRNASDVKFTTIVLGTAASMAGVLLQAGDKRVMGKHAYLMIHEIQSGVIGSMSEIEDASTFTKRLQDRILDILNERSTLDRSEIKDRWERREWWLDADEALELGFCDEIQ